ncbi:MAG: vWA domain-containing protein, partial [Steroidobacteraceae bacterium]
MSDLLKRLLQLDLGAFWSVELWRNLEFGAPVWLWLLPLIALLRRRTRPGSAPAVTYSSTELLKQASRANRARRGYWPVVLRAAAVTLIILALAQPRIAKDAHEENTEGIDLLLVLDASRSMDSQDFDFAGKKISRRAALEQAIGQFISQRSRDRIGLLGFAEKPFLISPLTLDHSWLLESLKEVRTSLGTAIGSAVEAAVDLLRRTDAG